MALIFSELSFEHRRLFTIHTFCNGIMLLRFYFFFFLSTGESNLATFQYQIRLPIVDLI